MLATIPQDGPSNVMLMLVAVLDMTQADGPSSVMLMLVAVLDMTQLIIQADGPSNMTLERMLAAVQGMTPVAGQSSARVDGSSQSAVTTRHPPSA